MASASGRLTEPSIAHRQACAAAGLELTLHGLRRSFASLYEWLDIPGGISAQIQGHAPQGVREQNYIRCPLHLLRVHHERIEAWILEQAWAPFDAQAEPGKLRVVVYLVYRNATRYNPTVIKSFRHKGLQAFFESGSKAGIQAAHAPKLARQLTRLDQAQQPLDMNLPGWNLHSLQGGLAGHWSVSVNGNWRMTFTFEGADAVLVDYQDYH